MKQSCAYTSDAQAREELHARNTRQLCQFAFIDDYDPLKNIEKIIEKIRLYIQNPSISLLHTSISLFFLYK